MSKRHHPGGQGSGVVKKRLKERHRDQDESDDDINQSQRPDFSLNQEADVGIIEKVSLKNFMCHSRLEVNFGPHVNFIVGRNGSGKSAVVTALVVGLGGKASVTSRGSTIKGFIKTGKQTGEVEVRLRNRGLDAYKPHMYGDTIIVQRKFTRDGVSKYVLRSKKGNLVSDKRDELNHILDQFNIQVDNPVAILNQETSRNFLNSKSPKDKYMFFLKATQLEQMRIDYSAANEQKAITMEIISQKEKTLPSLEREVLEWEQKFKALDALEELRDKVKKLKHEMAWAFVCEKEKGLDPLVKKLQQEDNRMPKFVSKAEEAKKKVEETTEKHKHIEEQIRVVTEELKALEPLISEAKQEVKKNKEKTKKAEMDVRKAEKEVRTATRDRNQVLERIKELKQSAQHDYEKDRLEREEKISALEERLQSLDAQQKVTQHQQEQFHSAVSKYKTDLYNLRRDEQGMQQNINQIKTQLQTLNAAKGNRLKRFGAYIPNVLKKIDEFTQKGLFHKKPKGPIGACFQLKNPQFALAVETCLRSLLYSFCCTDYHDEKVLQEIFEKTNKDGPRPAIIVSKFHDRIHDVSRFKARSKHPTVLDMIDVDDPVVANILIDQRGIESVILIGDNKEARKLMQHSPPQNCREAFTKAGDQLFSSPTFRYYSSNSDKANLLMANVEDEIVNLQNDLRNMEKEYEALQQSSHKLNEEIRKNSLEEKRCETQIMKIGDAMMKLGCEISDLKSVEDPAPIDVTTLEEEVEHYTEQITTLEERTGSTKEMYMRYKAELDQSEVAFKQVEERLKAKTDIAEPLEEEEGHTRNEIELAKSHRKHYESKLKDHQKLVNDLKKKVEEFKEEIESDILKATQICAERIKTRRTAQNLESEINQIHKRIKAEEKSRGNPEEITRKYHETQEVFKKIRVEVNHLCKFLEHLEKVMVHRQHQYNEFRRLIGLRAKYFFIVLLSNRNYNGKMSFNHSKGTLEMSVQPTKSAGDGPKDLKSLSGGERSFSTVCFILALWDAMESPFRCLDEFDVFMDMVNRRISMDMMMEVAKVQTGRQFIFLTPQDMSQLNICKNFRIFRMPDPDRGQATLPFRPEGEEEETNQE
ncbi:structural maintenance of chromosomes protein 6-like isoform X2 [Gigantopelta aegis]|uniref:structural maintenance of chromosomes protein 6-like isoform X2 n=1 Tax=Gigantopelta aegis TaxID=1735272 RepID=UPI001B88E04D|nr:structural maintenance of chromosomes protein 6-like isoform X2 [Gigantopelta aegis]